MSGPLANEADGPAAMPDATGPVAITGASGFVGRAVAGWLAGAGVPVRAIARGPVPAAAGVVHQAIGDYASVEELAGAIAGARCVLHLADRADRRGYDAATIGAAAERADALIAAMRRCGVRQVIVASSVYAAAAGRSRYGASKLAAERRFLAAAGVDAVILRLPPLYGPGGRGAFATLARAVRAGVPLPLELARAPRAFLDVRALAGLVAQLAAADDAAWVDGAGIHYPRDAADRSLRDLAVAIGAAVGRPARLVPLPFADRLLGAAPLPDAGTLARSFGRTPPPTAAALDYLRE